MEWVKVLLEIKWLVPLINGLRKLGKVGLAFVGGVLVGGISLWFSDSRYNRMSVYQDYELLWPGEQWYGRLSLGKHDGQDAITFAKVGIVQKKYGQDGNYTFPMGDVVFNLASAGTFKVENDQLIVDFVVDKRVRDSNELARQRISGRLSQKMCWAGEVTYEDYVAKKRHPGGMVLVNHQSLPDHNIKEWLQNALVQGK